MNVSQLVLGFAAGVATTLLMAKVSGPDPLTQINRCLTDKSCVVSRYEYTPYASKPEADTPSCPIFKMPQRAAMPSVSEVSLLVGRDPKRAERYLMQYIEASLVVDDANNRAITRAYEDYLAKCGKAEVAETIPDVPRKPKEKPMTVEHLGRPPEDYSSPLNEDEGWDFLPKDGGGKPLLE